MNSTNSYHYQREMLGRGYGHRRHWSLSDIPRTRMEIISDQCYLNNASDDLLGNCLTKK